MLNPLALEPALDLIETYAQQLLHNDRTPGYALAITDRTGRVAFRGYGHTDLSRTINPTPETLYEIGSVGKSSTAVVLMQLAAEGMVDLHAPMADRLPLFVVPSAFALFTQHHLLTHTSGLPSGTDHVPSHYHELWQMRHARVTIPPGERFMYSNLGDKALGMLIEHVTGLSYSQVVTDRLFQPLGLTHSAAAITSDIRHRLAPGYTHRHDDRPPLPRHGWVPATWLETDTGDGCLAMTAPELATWLRMLLNHGVTGSGERILTEEQFATVIDPHQGESPEPSYGYGLVHNTERDDNIEKLSHGGGMVGYVTQMLGDVASGLGVVVFNNDFGSPGLLAEFALKTLVAVANDTPLPDLPAMRDRYAVPNAGEYTGTWTGSNGTKATLEIVALNQGLAMQYAGTTTPLFACGHDEPIDTFVADHPDFDCFVLRFVRDEAGQVTELTHGPDWYAGASYAGPRAFEVPEEWAAYAGHNRG